MPPLPLDWGQVIREEVGHLGCEIEIEPGRLIAGNAGIMVSRVIYLKHGEGRDFLILDGAMNGPAFIAWIEQMLVPALKRGYALSPPPSSSCSKREIGWPGMIVEIACL